LLVATSCTTVDSGNGGNRDKLTTPPPPRRREGPFIVLTLSLVNWCGPTPSEEVSKGFKFCETAVDATVKTEIISVTTAAT
jgi:hypothetical protein